jgi:hypothetical protein
MLYTYDCFFVLKHRATPWRKIACCPPIYGIAIIHVCHNFIYNTLFTSLPIYFSTILNFNLHQVLIVFILLYSFSTYLSYLEWVHFCFTLFCTLFIDNYRRSFG